MSRYPATRKARPLVNNSTAPASDAQLKFIAALLEQAGSTETLESLFEGEMVQSRTASKAIDMLKAQIAAHPAPVRTAPAAPVVTSAASATATVADDDKVTEPGMYRRAADGVIFRVKFNKQKTRIYAERIITTPDLDDDGVQILHADGRPSFTTTFEYGYKYLGTLRASDRMTLEEATEYGAAFANCMVCGRHLKNPKSVALGIGPVCRGGV